MNTNNAKVVTKSARQKRILPLPVNKWYACLIILLLLVAAVFLLSLIFINAFPTSLTLSIIFIMFALIAVIWGLVIRKKRWVRVTGLAVAAIFVAVYGMGTYFLGTTYAMLAKISNENAVRTTNSQGLDVTQDSFNIYITGIDQWNSEKGYDLERSDVNMIITVCPKTRKILLTSIPRDSYVKLHRTGTYDKLTHTGIYGVDETLNTVQDWLGIDLDFYVKLNFSGARAIINAMGGIDVYSPVAFNSSISDFTYVKGWNHLRGKGALYFARERKAFEGNDSVRVENQQRVVQAIIKKLTSSTTLLTNYGDIIEAAGESLETSMSNSDIQKLVKVQLQDLGDWEVETQKIEGEYDEDYVASLTQESKFTVYKTKASSVKSCVDAINEVMNPSDEEIKEVEEKRKKESAINYLKKLLSIEQSTEDSSE